MLADDRECGFVNVIYVELFDVDFHNDLDFDKHDNDGATNDSFNRCAHDPCRVG